MNQQNNGNELESEDIKIELKQEEKPLIDFGDDLASKLMPLNLNNSSKTPDSLSVR